MGLRSPSALSRFERQQQQGADKVQPLRSEACRIDRKKENGIEHLHLLFPNAGREVERHDASYLLIAPNLATPLAEAFLRKLATLSPKSRHGMNTWLRLGFFGFLEAEKLQELHLGALDSSLFRRYVVWLNQLGPDKIKPRWSEVTRKQYLLAIRHVVDMLKTMPMWGRNLPAGLQIPTHQWRGASRKRNLVEILTDDELGKVYRACLNEISEIRRRVEQDLSLAASASHDLPTAPKSYRDYPTRAIALAALSDLLPDRIPSYTELMGFNGALLLAAKSCFGGIVDLRTAFAPSPRQLVPFIVMLAFHTRLNPETLLASKLDDFRKGDYLGAPRIFSHHFKGRSGRKQRPSAPIDESWDNPGSIYDFLIEWTSRIRPKAPTPAADKLFIYVPRTTRTRIHFFDVESKNGSNFSQVLHEFCVDHGLPNFTLRQIRPTMLDVGRWLMNGDIRAAQALGDHRNAETTNSHYTSDAQRKRNEERLGEIMSQRRRWIESEGKIDSRGKNGEEDGGAATPGWRCFDPYQSPLSPKGKLCVALTCPHWPYQ